MQYMDPMGNSCIYRHLFVLISIDISDYPWKIGIPRNLWVWNHLPMECSKKHSAVWNINRITGIHVIMVHVPKFTISLWKIGANVKYMDPMGVHAVLLLISWASFWGELQWTSQDTLSQQMLSIHPQAQKSNSFQQEMPSLYYLVLIYWVRKYLYSIINISL